MVTSTVSAIPKNMAKLNTEFRNLTFEDLEAFRISNHTFTQVYWNSSLTLGFTLNDGISVQAGTRNFTKSFTFNPYLKITKIETIITWCERGIMQINFYHYQQRLLAVGKSDEDVQNDGGRVEIFEINYAEQIIGCELLQIQYPLFTDFFFGGVTWIKASEKPKNWR